MSKGHFPSSADDDRNGPFGGVTYIKHLSSQRRGSGRVITAAPKEQRSKQCALGALAGVSGKDATLHCPSRAAHLGLLYIRCSRAHPGS